MNSCCQSSVISPVRVNWLVSSTVISLAIRLTWRGPEWLVSVMSSLSVRFVCGVKVVSRKILSTVGNALHGVPVYSVKTSVTTTDTSSSQDYTYPNDQTKWSHVTLRYTYLWSLASSLASRTFFASRALRVLRFSFIKSKQKSFKRHHKITKFLKKSSYSPLRSLHEHHPTVFPSLRSKAVKSLS